MLITIKKNVFAKQIVLIFILFRAPFFSDFWLGISILKNAQHLKRYKLRINACRVASQ